MCGIVGYIGERNAWPIVINGLKRLEYRGYDSSGIAIADTGTFNVYKKMGNVACLENFAKDKNKDGTAAIGHTRWATHGEPSDHNAHPHSSGDGRFYIIHNGIIENYLALKSELVRRGHIFKSDTDSEVLVHLIEEIQQIEQTDLLEATRLALNSVTGSFAIVLLDRLDPSQLIAARRGSPLLIGVGDREYFVASDCSPIAEHCNKVIYLRDNELALLKQEELIIKRLDNVIQPLQMHDLELKLEELEKGNFEHYMLKEIFEQPRIVKDCMRGRIDLKVGQISLEGLKNHTKQLKAAKRILIVGCGTSWHAGLIGEYLIEEYARVPVEVEYASEFRYRNPVIGEDDIVIAISQSGETADTIAAINLAKLNGATILSVCNVVGSSIPRLSDGVVYTHAGPEIGVASTKAFTAQVTVLTLMALFMAQNRGTITSSQLIELQTELSTITSKMQTVLDVNKAVKEIAKRISAFGNCLFLGRGIGFPVALEGALKLKEISYIHAEGYPAAEMKHGPIALIDANMPVIFIATKGPSYDKVISNIQEVKARKGNVIAIATEGDKILKEIADEVIEIPAVNECFLPLLAVIPLQLLSYYAAVMRGCNVDQPRNLAKSVTVE
ncbi:glutamine--fructose-6-phosphate transaminase [Mucilaginibacter yixingensis]|uniref:Glutamine--fructose-6-phosphate aminotransferase [isomerizing] n=1 Tax=Mucilaginibacter yixingensis TaxID=1295612 RepID=A0A2T5J9J2_9SPHI|nr:glutamine--fructose-6-phosphate transaminase (isomerizing) [Mucilaginibacter yixingensis]PTQ96694.1 glutamine--fructose-6-phosphate transaminase [Mucilaginibacter yixingensis]